MNDEVATISRAKNTLRARAIVRPPPQREVRLIGQTA
jgi:hypothetical protein